MKILKIDGDKAIVGAGGVERRIALNFLSNPRIGDYVIVHAGFAIERIDHEKAEETLRMLREL
jgi:hydrogenase expression/formation protein HypC